MSRGLFVPEYLEAIAQSLEPIRDRLLNGLAVRYPPPSSSKELAQNGARPAPPGVTSSSLVWRRGIAPFALLRENIVNGYASKFRSVLAACVKTGSLTVAAP
jgi:hypothetical protein